MTEHIDRDRLIRLVTDTIADAVGPDDDLTAAAEAVVDALIQTGDITDRAPR